MECTMASEAVGAAAYDENPGEVVDKYFSFIYDSSLEDASSDSETTQNSLSRCHPSDTATCGHVVPHDDALEVVDQCFSFIYDNHDLAVSDSEEAQLQRKLSNNDDVDQVVDQCFSFIYDELGSRSGPPSPGRDRDSVDSNSSEVTNRRADCDDTMDLILSTDQIILMEATIPPENSMVPYVVSIRSSNVTDNEKVSVQDSGRDGQMVGAINTEESSKTTRGGLMRSVSVMNSETSYSDMFNSSADMSNNSGEASETSLAFWTPQPPPLMETPTSHITDGIGLKPPNSTVESEQPNGLLSPSSHIGPQSFTDTDTFPSPPSVTVPSHSSTPTVITSLPPPSLSPPYTLSSSTSSSLVSSLSSPSNSITWTSNKPFAASQDTSSYPASSSFSTSSSSSTSSSFSSQPPLSFTVKVSPPPEVDTLQGVVKDDLVKGEGVVEKSKKKTKKKGKKRKNEPKAEETDERRTADHKMQKKQAEREEGMQEAQLKGCSGGGNDSGQPIQAELEEAGGSGKASSTGEKVLPPAGLLEAPKPVKEIPSLTGDAVQGGRDQTSHGDAETRRVLQPATTGESVQHCSPRMLPSVSPTAAVSLPQERFFGEGTTPSGNLSPVMTANGTVRPVVPFIEDCPESLAESWRYLPSSALEEGRGLSGTGGTRGAYNRSQEERTTEGEGRPPSGGCTTPSGIWASSTPLTPVEPPLFRLEREVPGDGSCLDPGKGPSVSDKAPCSPPETGNLFGVNPEQSSGGSAQALPDVVALPAVATALLGASRPPEVASGLTEPKPSSSPASLVMTSSPTSSENHNGGVADKGTKNQGHDHPAQTSSVVAQNVMGQTVVASIEDSSSPLPVAGGGTEGSLDAERSADDCYESDAQEEEEPASGGLVSAVSRVVRRSMRRMRRLRLSGRGPRGQPRGRTEEGSDRVSEETSRRREVPLAPEVGMPTVRSPATASIIVNSLVSSFTPVPPPEELRVRERLDPLPDDPPTRSHGRSLSTSGATTGRDRRGRTRGRHSSTSPPPPFLTLPSQPHSLPLSTSGTFSFDESSSPSSGIPRRPNYDPSAPPFVRVATVEALMVEQVPPPTSAISSSTSSSSTSSSSSSSTASSVLSSSVGTISASRNSTFGERSSGSSAPTPTAVLPSSSSMPNMTTQSQSSVTTPTRSAAPNSASASPTRSRQQRRRNRRRNNQDGNNNNNNNPSSNSRNDSNNNSSPTHNVRRNARAALASRIEGERLRLQGGTWFHNHSGLMASLSVTVTAFNISRFAVLGARFGWPFVVQWMVVSAVLGLPLMTFHVTAGQYLGAGVVDMWVISPIFQGVGYSLLLAQVALGVYCCVPLSWLFVYFRDSFITHNAMFRWADCRPNCSSVSDFSSVIIEGVPSYFNSQVLQRDEPEASLQGLGSLKFDLAFNIALIWVITFVALSRGNQSYGKMCYIVFLIPLLCYLVVCLYLASWTKEDMYISRINNFGEFFKNSRSWVAASREVFLVWGIHGAVLQQMAAHNKRGHPLYRDTTVITIITTLALVLAAVTGSTCVSVFHKEKLRYEPSSFETSESAEFLVKDVCAPYTDMATMPPNCLKKRAFQRHEPSFYYHHDNLYTGIRIRPMVFIGMKSESRPPQNSGYQSLHLATELFPALLAIKGAEEISPFWSSLLYFSLLLFGIAQQLAVWRTVVEAVIRLDSERLRAWETFITFLCCFFGFSAALPMATEIGIHVVYFLDYVVSCCWWLMILQLVEVFAILFVRGKPYSGQDMVTELMGTEDCKRLWLGPLTSFSWNIMIPVGLLVLSISSFKAGDYREVFLWASGRQYWPVWVCQTAACLQLLPILLVILVGLVLTCWFLLHSDLDPFERVQMLYRPPPLQRLTTARRNTRTQTEVSDDSDADTRDLVREGQGRSGGGSRSSSPVRPYSDPPPKYTPPPSYSTATGVSFAKMVNSSFRHSMRRLRDSLRVRRSGSAQDVESTPPSQSCDSSPLQEGNGRSHSSSSVSEEPQRTSPYIPPPDYVTALQETPHSRGQTTTQTQSDPPPDYSTLDPLRRLRAIATLSGTVDATASVSAPPPLQPEVSQQQGKSRRSPRWTHSRTSSYTPAGTFPRNLNFQRSSLRRSLSSSIRRSARQLLRTFGGSRGVLGSSDNSTLVDDEAPVSMDTQTGIPDSYGSQDTEHQYAYANFEMVTQSEA